jgi:molybdopterin molybdotransferase
MITFNQAYTILLESASFLGTEHLSLADAANRILARDVTADVNIPPFDKAAMDGYACRRADLASALTIIETIPAGRLGELDEGERFPVEFQSR